MKKFKVFLALIIATSIFAFSGCKTSPWQLEIVAHTLALGDEMEIRALYNNEEVIDEDFSFVLSNDSLAEIVASANRFFLLAKEVGELTVQGVYRGKTVGELEVTIKSSNQEIIRDYLLAQGNKVEVQIHQQNDQQLFFLLDENNEDILIEFAHHFVEDEISYESEMLWNITSGLGEVNFVFTSPTDYESSAYFTALIANRLNFMIDDVVEISGESEDLFDLVNAFAQGEVENAFAYYQSFLVMLKSN